MRDKNSYIKVLKYLIFSSSIICKEIRVELRILAIITQHCMGLEPLDSLSFLFFFFNFFKFLIRRHALSVPRVIVVFGTGERLDMTFSGSLQIKDNLVVFFS